MANEQGTIRVREASRRAWDELQDALTRVTPYCADDERYTADTLTNGDKHHMTQICARCPILTQCETYATQDKPIGGHWPGRQLKPERQVAA